MCGASSACLKKGRAFTFYLNAQYYICPLVTPFFLLKNVECHQLSKPSALLIL